MRERRGGGGWRRGRSRRKGVHVGVWQVRAEWRWGGRWCEGAEGARGKGGSEEHHRWFITDGSPLNSDSSLKVPSRGRSEDGHGASFHPNLHRSANTAHRNSSKPCASDATSHSSMPRVHVLQATRAETHPLPVKGRGSAKAPLRPQGL